MTEDHSAELAENDAHLDLPVAPYVGLTQAEAEEFARKENRYVRILTSLEGPRRLDLAYRRVNVVVDETGVVTAADAG